MSENNNAAANELLPPDELIKRNLDSALNPAEQKTEKKSLDTTTPEEHKSPDVVIAENNATAGAEKLLPPDQLIQKNVTEVKERNKPQEDNSMQAQIAKFDPENPDYMVQDFIGNLKEGKSIYEAHKANPKLKFGVDQSIAMMDYYNSPQNADPHPIVNAAKSLAQFVGSGLKGVYGGASDLANIGLNPTPQAFKEVGKDALTIADVIAGVPLEVYQMVGKAQEGGIELADNLGIGIDPNSGVLSIKPKTKYEKLVNFMARNEIDSDRARVNAKAPSNIGKLLYYAGEKPTENGGQQSYAQLLRPVLASYLVPSVKQRMLLDPSITEGEATQQWVKDSQQWGSSTLQKAAAAIPAQKEDIAAATQLLVPEASTFGVAAHGLGMLAAGGREMARIGELESLMPKAEGMTDIAETAAKGGTFYVDSNGSVTAGPQEAAGPRTPQQMREDMYNANLLHKDVLENIEATRLERSGGKDIKLGPWGIPKPYLWADGISQKSDAAAEAIKNYATAGALGTAVPIATGAIGAYNNREHGPLSMGEGFLKGAAFGAAGEFAGYTALKGLGKGAGVLADLGKVKQGLGEAGGNVFQIAGDLPTSSKTTKDIFGGKIGSITSPTANWISNNLVQWGYQGVEAGTLAAAMGVVESAPREEMASQVANGIAMMMVPHIISSAIHESPASRENRLRKENASIYYAKKDASDETKRNMNDVRDYREVVNQQKSQVFEKEQALRETIAKGKAKPEEVQAAQENLKQAGDRLTELMSANSETMHEYGRQADLLFSNGHRGLNGPLRAGQNNVGLEVLTKPQILQKLIDANKELASTPQGLAKLEMIASQDGMVINSAGGVELRAGTDLAEALKNEPIMFDPSKTTAIVNVDNARNRAGVYGSTIYDALSHEIGHLYGRTEEFQKANSELLSQLFSTNIFHDDGTIASEDVGAVSNDQLKDMIWNNYLKGRTDEQKKAWLESQGMWDRANNRFIDKEVIPYAREEYIAEMAGNSLHQMTNRGGETAVMKWARVNNSNNMLARAIQSVLGNGGPDPTKPSPVMGAEFTPEIAAATEKAIQAVNDYNGHIAPVIDAQPVVEITQKELKKNKGLLKKYGIQSGMFQTQVFAIVRDAKGNVVSRVPIADGSISEGSWVLDPSTGKPKQTKGYAPLPYEANSVQIPEGGSLDVKREVAMQPDGQTPIQLSDSLQKKNQTARRDMILNALGITEIPENGVTWRGTLSPEQIQNIKGLPENVVPKTIKDVILEMNETLASGSGQRWLTEYSPTSGKKGKRKSLMMKQYDLVPIGLHFTKDGNFNVTCVSATRLFNKLHAWGAEFPHILDMWGGSKSEFFNDFTTKYLANWQKGKEGWEGLDSDEETAKLKRDIFDNFLNLKDNATDHLNQNRFYLKRQKGDDGPEGRDRTIMSIRADHVSSIQKSNAQPIPVDYYKAKINAMPESGLPYEERPEDAVLKPLTFAPKGEQPAITPDILRGISAVHVPVSKPQETKFVFTTSTKRDDAIKKMIATGDDQGIRDLNRTTILHALSDLKHIPVTIEDTKGVYQGDKEVSSIIKVTTDNQQDLNRVRSRIADAAKMFQQMEFIEEKMGAGKRNLLGETDEDGFKHIGSSTLYVKGVTENQIESARKQAGIDGLTLADGRIELYDRGDDPEFFNRLAALDTALRQAGGVVTQTEAGVASVKSYSEDPQRYAGTIGYDDQSLHIHSASGEQERLKTPLIQKLMGLMGRPMEAPKAGKKSYFEAKDVTPEQVKKQAGIAQRFTDLPLNDLKNPLVQKAYEHLNTEIAKQFDYLTEGEEGTKFTSQPWSDGGEPYASSADAINDIRTKNSLRFLKTDPSSFGPEGEDFSYHPLLQDSGRVDANGVKLTYNDLFRAVHDAIAHGLFGAEFGPVGEESAWQTHMRTLDDPWARWALTTETRGQNSYINYRDQMLGKDGMPLKKGDEGYIPLNKRGFAEQKASLLPLEDSLTGDKKVDEVTRKLMKEIGEQQSQGSAGGISFMPDNKIDEEYAKSLRFDANPETAQKLVDQAAERAGYDSSRYWYHGTAGDRFNVRGRMSWGRRLKRYHGTAGDEFFVPKGRRGVAAHVSLNKEEAWNFAESASSASARGEAKPNVRQWYLKKGELFDPTNEDHLKKVSESIEPVREGIRNQPLSSQWALKDDTYNPNTWKDKIWDFFEDSEIQKFIKDAGFIGYMDRETPQKPWKDTDNAAIFDPNSLKEAARVTHDNQNNVIPLSQRFDASKQDIRFMPKSEEPDISDEGHVFPKDLSKPFEFTPRIAMNFMPASEKIDWEDYLHLPTIALAADRMGIGQAYVGPTGAKQPLSMKSEGGAGFSTLYRDEEHNPIWAFSTLQAAKNFLKRINDVANQFKTNSVLVSPTLLAPDNHLKNQTGQLGYVEALEAALKAKMVKESDLTKQLNEIIKRISESKSAKAKEATKALSGITTFKQFAQAVREKSFNFGAAEWIMKKAAQKKLPITAKELDQMGILPSQIAKDLAHEGYYELPTYSMVSLFEVPKDQQPEKGNFHNSYPYVVRGKSIGYLKHIINLAQATKEPKIFTKRGDITAQPLMTVMPILDSEMIRKALSTLQAYDPKTNK